MSNFQIEKVLAIPAVLSANTIYLVPGIEPEKFNIFVTDSSGLTVKSIGVDLPAPVEEFDVIERVTGLTRTLTMTDKKTVLRYETDGAKELIIDAAQGFLPNTIFHVTNRSANGDLTIVPSAGMSINPPKGGSLVLEPSDIVSLHVVVSTVMDSYGSTAGGAVVSPAALPVLPVTPQFYSVMGPDFWDEGDLTWNGTSYIKNANVAVGDTILVNTLMTASQMRITYTSVGLTSFGLGTMAGESIMFPQRPSGTWTDTVSIPSGTLGVGSYLVPDANDTVVSSIVISNIEIYY